MMELDLTPDLDARLARAASEAQVAEAFVAREARLFEDREECGAGIRSLAGSTWTISLEEMECRSRVAD